MSAQTWVDNKNRVSIWPLQDIRLLRVVCARINRPCIPPAHLKRRYLHTYWAYTTPLDLPLVCLTPYNMVYNNIVYRLS